MRRHGDTRASRRQTTTNQCKVSLGSPAALRSATICPVRRLDGVGVDMGEGMKQCDALFDATPPFRRGMSRE